jgi:hypothetical protein
MVPFVVIDTGEGEGVDEVVGVVGDSLLIVVEMSSCFAYSCRIPSCRYRCLDLR